MCCAGLKCKWWETNVSNSPKVEDVTGINILVLIVCFPLLEVLIGRNV